LTWRSTVVYWVLFAALGSYYLAFERKPPPPSEMQRAREKVLNVYSDDVKALVLRRDGKEIRCERRDKRWQIVKPENAKVPSDLVSALLENLTDKQDAEEITAKPRPEDLQAFGLSASSPEVEIEVSGGKKMSVKLGGKNPPQTAIYAQTDFSPRILLVGVNVQYYADLLYEAGTKSG
jgi:Domain of unknown function (DUF4340)